MTSTSRLQSVFTSATVGAGAGLLAAGVMVATEKIEQVITHRPNSYVPGRALLTLLGRHPSDEDKPTGWNHAMHFGTGAALGALRGLWSSTGIRGPVASVWHSAVRLAFDQTVENTTGVGAPPATWPRKERVVDVAHKVIFSLVTGFISDKALPPKLASRHGTESH
ncbi:MAG: hypothetical protein JWO93_3220 [Micrococcaceae bacterium]|nr:hypothetical protein [Micrococcaceae bacterium]